MPRTKDPEGEKAFNLQIGQRMRYARKKRGYTLKKLAEETHCNYASYVSYEGGRTPPPLYVIYLLCDFLQVPSDFLFGLNIDVN